MQGEATKINVDREAIRMYRYQRQNDVRFWFNKPQNKDKWFSVPEIIQGLGLGVADVTAVSSSIRDLRKPGADRGLWIEGAWMSGEGGYSVYRYRLREGKATDSPAPREKEAQELLPDGKVHEFSNINPVTLMVLMKPGFGAAREYGGVVYCQYDQNRALHLGRIVRGVKRNHIVVLNEFTTIKVLLISPKEAK